MDNNEFKLFFVSISISVSGYGIVLCFCLHLTIVDVSPVVDAMPLIFLIQSTDPLSSLFFAMLFSLSLLDFLLVQMLSALFASLLVCRLFSVHVVSMCIRVYWFDGLKSPNHPHFQIQSSESVAFFSVLMHFYFRLQPLYAKDLCHFLMRVLYCLILSEMDRIAERIYMKIHPFLLDRQHVCLM